MTPYLLRDEMGRFISPWTVREWVLRERILKEAI
jgi:hypothetical protein